MPDNYDDIKHLSRPQYDDLPPMSMHDRAAQFSPFAALVGYDDAVAETARLTDKRIELSEEHMEELDRITAGIREIIDTRPLLTLTRFVPDKRKDGGSYVDFTGELRRIDDIQRLFIFTDKTEIPMDDIIAIRQGSGQG
ncbi:MAG: hypothetical protein J6F31_05205 [Oscillospiraceae bacterium]|nr:hypothetical protein [Oscillospiraceae bacterium]